MNTLTLNDGTVLNGTSVETPDALWLYLEAGPLAPYFDALNDPEKTKKIVADNYGVPATYSGYKHLFWIKEEPDKSITAGLRKQ